MNDRNEVDRLKDLACEMRKKLLYLCGHYEGSVHIGGDLSMADLLVGLFHHGLHVDPENISMEDRVYPVQRPRSRMYVYCHGYERIF